MAAALTSVKVNGTTVTVSDSMAIELPSTTTMTAVPVILTAAEGYGITFRGTAVTSGTSFNANFSETSSATIVVTATADESDTKSYSLTVTKGTWDGVLESGVVQITKMGWFAAREFNGDLDTYAAGGLAVPLGSFKPKHVINIMITGGFTGEWDFTNKKLKVYKGGSEATTAQLRTAEAKYTMILME